MEQDQISCGRDPLGERLRALRTRPVDIAGLQARIRREIPRPAGRPLTGWIRRSRIGRAVAAVLLLAASLALVLTLSTPGTAMASSQDLLQIHAAMMEHRRDMTEVGSIDAANAVLAGRWPDAPPMPDMPHQETIACSVHRVGKAKAAVVSLAIDGVPVSLAAADASQVQIRGLTKVVIDDREYQVSGSGATNMVLTKHNGNWYCLMGELPQSTLISFWSKLQMK